MSLNKFMSMVVIDNLDTFFTGSSVVFPYVLGSSKVL